MKTLALLAAALLALLPLPALASGFYMAPWAEFLLFLVAAPGGWVVLALALVALGFIVYAVVRK